MSGKGDLSTSSCLGVAGEPLGGGERFGNGAYNENEAQTARGQAWRSFEEGGMRNGPGGDGTAGGSRHRNAQR